VAHDKIVDEIVSALAPRLGLVASGLAAGGGAP
jgi:hypothetical protein